MKRTFVVGILLGLLIVVACSILSYVIKGHLLVLAQRHAPLTFTTHLEARASLLWLRWWTTLTPLILAGCVAAAGLIHRLWSRRGSQANTRTESNEATSREVARTDQLTIVYRWLLFWFLISMVWPLAPAGLATVLPPLNLSGLVELVLMTTYWGLLLATVGRLAYYGFATARLLGSQTPLLWGIAVLVPLVSVVAVLILSVRARKAWAARGVTVGVFGPKRSSGGRSA